MILLDETSPDPPRTVEWPMLIQEWRDCAFVHWRYPADAVRPHIPATFALDLADGSAWVSSITCRMPLIRPSWLPSLPGLRRTIESHLRTYVVDPEGRRGIWMLSLDVDPIAAAAIGRVFALPYWAARSTVERDRESAAYRVERRAPGRGRLDLELELGTHLPEEDQTELDEFLTSRWILYAGVGRAVAAIFTEHPRWHFREAAIRTLSQTHTNEVGLPTPRGDPLVHFSDGTSAALSWPIPVPSALRANDLNLSSSALGGSLRAQTSIFAAGDGARLSQESV